jgi:ribosomal protein S18 acetylase RimI-like enzyme
MTVIRPYRVTDEAALWTLQQAYAARFPGAAVVPPALYASPGFAPGPQGSANVLCALDEAGQLRGYGALFPVASTGPDGPTLDIWSTLKLDPPELYDAPLADELLAAMRERAAAARATLGAAGPASLVLECVTSESAQLSYARAHGFARRASAYAMVRPLAEPVATPDPPPGVELRLWKMPTEAEQRAYLAQRNTAFPRYVWGWDEFRYFLSAPMWAAGTSVAAFAGEELVGALLAYWDPAGLKSPETAFGYTEEIFVRADWRGHGIGRAMIARALQHLAAQGLAEAHLQVNATNEGALSLYTALGYKVTSETLHLSWPLA